MINNDKIFGTEMGVYACSQGLFGPNEAVENVGDFQLGDCNNGHEDPDLDKAEESEEGIMASAAIGISKVGGVIVAGIFKACGWLAGVLSSCPWLMVVIFVVLAVAGIISFAIKKSNEAEDDEEVKKARVLDKLKYIAKNDSVKTEFKNMMNLNYKNYSSSIAKINNSKSGIESKLKSFGSGSITVKFWKEDKFDSQLKKSMLNMIKADKGTKQLSKFPIMSSTFVQIDIQNPKSKDSNFCNYLNSLAKELSTDSLVLKVNKSNTGLISEAFVMNITDKFVNSVKSSYK